MIPKQLAHLRLRVKSSEILSCWPASLWSSGLEVHRSIRHEASAVFAEVQSVTGPPTSHPQGHILLESSSPW